ncbi:MAG: polyribonucleotide nucleotidyltransferase [Planctomycetes bacterium]|nr:polyribonucleotide nucleotidyltransferase [Planctomycetota bacterium]
MIHRVSCDLGGKEFSIEVGRVAKQANGSAWVRYADTVVLGTVCMGDVREFREDDMMVPLTVDYREKTSAAGKFPGGFIKREGRPTQKEVLTCRLVDRPMRPLFPPGFLHDTQVQIITFSADKQNDPDILAMNSAFASVHVSDIPFHAALGAVRVGRIDGKFIVNPTVEEIAKSDIEIIVAGSAEAVTMVEGGAKEVSEEVMVGAIEFAHGHIRTICGLMEELRRKVGKPKAEVSLKKVDAKIYDYVKKTYGAELWKAIMTHSKHERSEFVVDLRDRIVTEMCGEEGTPGNPPGDSAFAAKIAAALGTTDRPLPGPVKIAFYQAEEEITRDLILQGKRSDGRGLADVRPISIEVGVLPRTHGSAIFTRGETQALVTCTLGTEDDQQRVDGLIDEYKKRFILHYNFPSFSVGETKPNRGPGRREIGHGDLAERSIDAVAPAGSEFPYTVRVVSDILESNGSSSMATVCGGTLSMMDAGVPIKRPVAGVAMGLVKEGDRAAVLTDILGSEDHIGDMDFKVAGTEAGITGFQMDLKTTGITPALMRQALDQAKAARLHILGEMRKALTSPRAEISRLAPKILQIQINPSKIGLVIGPGGKTIRKIEADTGAKVEIAEDDSGLIMVSGPTFEVAEKARKIIDGMCEEVTVGRTYAGTISGIKEFGCFVELPNGQEGLVHISELSNGYVSRVEDILKMKDAVKVKVISVDETGKIRLSRKQVLIEEGAPPEVVAPRDPAMAPAGGDGGRPPYRGGDRGPRRGPGGPGGGGGYRGGDRGPRPHGGGPGHGGPRPGSGGPAAG